MPGNPRYQPKSLQPVFEYEHLYQDAIRVELAVLETLGDIGVIPKKDAKLLTQKVKDTIIASITTSEIDRIEREITKHDVRALVRLIQEHVPKPLARWVHIPLTSNDVLSTAQALQFTRAHLALTPLIHDTLRVLATQAKAHAEQLQVGRTHGQHALPITVGFWLATITHRVLENAKRMDRAALGLHGKISGAVGAYNAQSALGIDAAARKTNEVHPTSLKLRRAEGKSFEERVLTKLDVPVAPISTQLTPPEPLAEYLFSCVLMSASLAQFARDCRHLMRSEIGEVHEQFVKGQVGSSTMAHKRNPITFENIEGMYLRTKSEFGKVLDTLISEHQRDLVGSSVARDYAIIPINLAQQLETLLRTKDKKTFLERISFDTDALTKNFDTSAVFMVAEPIYIALQMAGYTGDAHELINHTAVPMAQAEGISVLEALERAAESDFEAKKALKAMPEDVKRIIRDPKRYTGAAKKKTLEVVKRVEKYL